MGSSRSARTRLVGMVRMVGLQDTAGLVRCRRVASVEARVLRGAGAVAGSAVLVAVLEVLGRRAEGCAGDRVEIELEENSLGGDVCVCVFGSIESTEPLSGYDSSTCAYTVACRGR